MANPPVFREPGFGPPEKPSLTELSPRELRARHADAERQRDHHRWTAMQAQRTADDSEREMEKIETELADRGEWW